MSHPASFSTARDPLPDHEQKQAALSYLNEAWAEARHEGVDGDCLAQASLFTALAELVSTYGEDAVAKFVEGRSGPREERRVFAGAGEAVICAAVIVRLDAERSSTPRLLDSITTVSGILDHPPSRVTTIVGGTIAAPYAFNVSRNRTGSPVEGVVTSPCHITRLPRTKVPTGQPVTRTPS